MNENLKQKHRFQYFYYLPVIFFVILLILPFIVLYMIFHFQHPPNVFLFTIDTLRADRLGCYGCQKARTPFIDKFARHSKLFTRTLTTSPETLPAHASLFTGRHLSSHLCLDNRYTLAKSEKTISELFLQKGYQTRAVTNAVMSFHRGFEQGFEVFNAEHQTQSSLEKEQTQTFVPYTKEKLVFSPEMTKNALSAENTTNRVLSELNNLQNKPLFLWAHYWDPHNPYDPPRLYRLMYDCMKGMGRDFFTPAELKEIRVEKIILTEKEKERLNALYNAEVAYFDREWGRLMISVQSRFKWKNLIVIFVGDHGESLYDHDYYIGHGLSIKNPVLSIPLILGGYSITPGLNRSLTSISDIMPSIMDIMAVDKAQSENKLSGHSFVSQLFRGIEPNGPKSMSRRIFSRSNMIEINSVQTDAWKIIMDDRSKRLDIFDLINDPAENEICLPNSHKTPPRSLLQTLDQWKSQFHDLGDPTAKARDEKKLHDLLIELGYLDTTE